MSALGPFEEPSPPIQPAQDQGMRARHPVHKAS
jgi:hypothetical protein